MSLILLCMVLLTSCSSVQGEGETFYYDFAQDIVSLDPQFTTEEQAHTLLVNCMEGLVRQTATGAIEPAVASEITTNDDGSVYTFILREGVLWSDGSAVTSHDFATALRRLFSPDLPSPYATSFLAIEGAAGVLSGELPQGSLGIQTPDDMTLVIHLEQPDAFFLSALSHPAALPCKQSFFEETRGRYGLDGDSLLTNGAFTLSSWNDERIVLMQNPTYHDEVLPEAVVFYLGQDDPQGRLLEGDTDAGVLSSEVIPEAGDKGLNYQAFDNSVWAVAFNQNNSFFADEGIRQALQMTLDREQLWQLLDDGIAPSVGVIPPTTRLPDGTPYHNLADHSLAPVYSPEAGHALYKNRFTELIESPDLSNLTLIISEEEPGHMVWASAIQRMWQENLSLFVNIEPLPREQYDLRIQNRDYNIAIVELISNVNDPSGILGQFVSTSGDNLTAYSNPQYDELVQGVATARSADDMVSLSMQAEDILLGDATIIPISLNTTYFASKSSVRGVDYSPYSGRVSFVGATK